MASFPALIAFHGITMHSFKKDLNCIETEKYQKLPVKREVLCSVNLLYDAAPFHMDIATHLCLLAYTMCMYTEDQNLECCIL